MAIGSPALRASVPNVTATAAGTPALAIRPKSCRRVIATLFLFLFAGLFDRLRGRGLQFLRVCPVRRYPHHASFVTAVEPLRGYPRSAAYGSGNRAHQACGSHFQSARGAVDRRICIWRSRQMNRHGFKRSHLPYHAFFCASDARNARPDRPHTWNLIEVAGSAGCVRDRTLTAEFVEAPAFAVSFITKRGGE